MYDVSNFSLQSDFCIQPERDLQRCGEPRDGESGVERAAIAVRLDERGGGDGGVEVAKPDKSAEKSGMSGGGGNLRVGHQVQLHARGEGRHH